MKKSIFFLSIAILMILASCNSSDEPEINIEQGNEQEKGTATNGPSDYTPLILTTWDGSQGGCNFFSIKFLCNAILSDEELTGNPCFSTRNIVSLLSILANGDRSESQAAILRLLDKDEKYNSVYYLNIYYKNVISHLSHLDNQVECNLANAIILPPESKSCFSKRFGEAIHDIYKPDSLFMDPSTPEVLSAINNWCEDRTDSKIKDYLTAPLDGEAAVLCAAYFKGRWQTPFNKDASRKMDFRCLNGKIVPAMFMCAEKLYCLYDENELGTAVSIFFGNGHFKMTCFLPKEELSLREVALTLNDYLLSPVTARKVNLRLPRFEGEFNGDLIGLLCKVSPEFDLSQGFDNMAPPSLIHVSNIRHAAKIKIDEEGAEAAAHQLTPQDRGILTDKLATVADITFDRPFIYTISENSTDAIVFMGCVTEL